MTRTRSRPAPDRRATIAVCVVAFVIAGCRPSGKTAEGLAAIELSAAGTYPLAAYRFEPKDRFEESGRVSARWVEVEGRYHAAIVGRGDFRIALRVGNLDRAVVSARVVIPAGPAGGTADVRMLFSEEATGVWTTLAERTVAAESAELRATLPGDPPTSGIVAIETSTARDTVVAWIEPTIANVTRVRGSPPTNPANVVIVTADTTRLDDLGVFGGPVKTPRLSDFARQGIIFRNAHSVAFGTTPSHASLFTSLHAFEHGVYDNDSVLRADAVTLAETLSERGYATAAFVGARPVSRAVGLDQGFHLYDDLFLEGRSQGLGSLYESHERRASVTIERFHAWLAARRADPFFAWIHFYDPHQPYAPPPDHADAYVRAVAPSGVEPDLRRLFESRNGDPLYLGDPERTTRPTEVVQLARARYRGELSFVDQQFGRVVETLRQAGAYDGTLLVFIADHGENFAEGPGKMAFNHGGLFARVTNLPMIMKLRGSERGGTEVDFLLGSHDVAPTILDVLGISPPATWSGRSFRAQLDPPANGEFRDTLFLEGAHRHEASIRTREWMYREIRSRHRGDTDLHALYGYERGLPEQLFDLRSDPGERRNVRRDRQTVAHELQTRLRQFLDRPVGPSAKRPESKDHAEGLKALGYLQ